MKIAIILGTRPEIIKLSPIINKCQAGGLDYFIIHTNQHYSDNMDQSFFRELNLTKPKYNLNIGSGKHGDQTGRMMIELEKVLLKESPDLVLVQGDTNSVLAGALVAAKLNIKIGHVEAGLRSYDKSMPEEVNRVVADHLSDYLFCPTNKQRDILTNEGIKKDKIYVTGNTIVDAVMHAERSIDIKLLQRYGLKEKAYILLTMHRPLNVDDKCILEKQLNNITRLAENKNLMVLFPVHPRTMKNIEEFKIAIPKVIKTIEPVSFVELITFERFSKIILTDSGGIQEEACILKIPTLNLRKDTERPECVEVGASKIVGFDYDALSAGFDYYNQFTEFKWLNPFGDGKSADLIIKHCFD